MNVSRGQNCSPTIKIQNTDHYFDNSFSNLACKNAEHSPFPAS